MRIAVLGTGRMAEIRIATLVALEKVEKVFVVSGNEERRMALASRFDVEACDVTELGDELDAVIVCSRTSSHREGLDVALDRRIPVFCEKPIALDLAGTAQALADFTAATLEVQVGFHRRFDPEIRQIHERWEHGELGTPYVVRLASHDRDLTSSHYIPTSGGIWRDLHIHDFDLLRFLSGEEIEAVTAHGTVRKHGRFAEHGDSDTAAALLETKGGIPCVVTGTRHNPGGYDVRVEVIGSASSVAAGIGPRSALRPVDASGTAESWEGFPERFADAFAAETSAFVDLVAGQGPNFCPGSAALEALRVAVACELSTKEGRQVRLEEISIPEEVVQ